MITKYKRTVVHANICLNMHDHRLKFKVLNKVLVMKDQDSKRIEYLKL